VVRKKLFVILLRAVTDRRGLTSYERRLAAPNRRQIGALLQRNVGSPSTVDVGLECGGIPVAFDLDPGERRANFGEIGRVERDAGRADVLL